MKCPNQFPCVPFRHGQRDIAGMLLQKGHSKSRCYWSGLFLFCWSFGSAQQPANTLLCCSCVTNKSRSAGSATCLLQSKFPPAHEEFSFCWQEHREAGRHWWAWIDASQHEALAKKLLLCLVDKIPVLEKFKNLQEFLVQRYQPGRHLLPMTWCFPPPPAPQHEFFLPLTVYIVAQTVDSPTKTTPSGVISRGQTRI